MKKVQLKRWMLGASAMMNLPTTYLECKKERFFDRKRSLFCQNFAN